MLSAVNTPWFSSDAPVNASGPPVQSIAPWFSRMRRSCGRGDDGAPAPRMSPPDQALVPPSVRLPTPSSTPPLRSKAPDVVALLFSVNVPVLIESPVCAPSAAPYAVVPLKDCTSVPRR